MSAIAPIALVILALLAALVHQRARRRRWQRDENMPIEIRDAALLASEQGLRIRRPIRAHGRLDQLLLMTGRWIVLIETKHRQHPTVHPSDTAQLSLYRFLYQRRPFGRLIDVLLRRRYTEYAYIRFVTPKGVVYRRTTLLDNEQIVTLYRRHRDVVSGREAPVATAFAGLCRTCAYRTKCSHVASTH